jgi:hypothetical protein
MKPPPGVPDGLDAHATQRITHTFLVVRITRGSLLLLFLATALVAVEVKGWPPGVAAAIAVTMLLQIGALVANARRLTHSTARRLPRPPRDS